MMTLNIPRRTSRSGGPAARPRPGRRGSVLVVVLALLSALMLLGFLFFTIASQERENARYFTAGQKWYSAGLTADELMDFALEQVIVGPQDDLANSALWGGRYSLLASLIGDDLQPYNGRGVNVADFGTGVPGVDVTGDGAADVPVPGDLNSDGVQDQDGDGNTVNDQLALHLGDFSTSAAAALQNYRYHFAKPDVGYTYPDMNSPFLAYVGTEPMTGNRVVIPSYHRPQYLRGFFADSTTWYTEPATAPFVMRPHSERPARVFNYETGEVMVAESGGTPIPRFEGGAGGPFFTAPASEAKLGTATDPVEGFWDRTAATAGIEHKYDADPDNDGVADAIWMDLDHPIEETPDGTEKFLPLFAVTIHDLDGLLNVNAHGNVYGVPASLASMPAGVPGNPFEFLSKGNEGRRRSEVNPQYALVDGPTALPTGADYTQHTRFFGAAPTSPGQLANMEWWFLLAGRGEIDSSGKAGQLYPGRNGEANLLDDALAAASQNSLDYPRPGQTGSDEAAGVADGNRGSAFVDLNGQLFPPSMIFPAPRHPEDVQGQGTYVLNDGKTPLVQAPPAALTPDQNAALASLGRVRVPVYQNYWLPSRTLGIGADWAYALNANFPAAVRLVTAAAAGTGLMSADGRLVDDPGETMLDAEQARDQLTDSIFGAEEAAALHLADIDRTNNGIVSRLIKLAPANFETADDKLARRRRTTTVSSDLKSFTYPDPTGTARSWEVEQVNTQFPNLPTFPPRFLALDAQGGYSPLEPFRPEARGFLASLPNMSSAPNARIELKQLTRKLSVNHVASAYVSSNPNDTTPRFYLRPVTPHPVRHPTNGRPTLGAGQVTRPPGLPNGPNDPRFGVADQLLSRLGQTPGKILAIDHDGDPATFPVPNPALQEWHARRDRQNLARDIYTLLYTFGEPTGVDLKTATPPYTPAQLIEMAQFAVNVVDAMDPDDTITCFVFDADLSAIGAGYTPQDDGYSDPVTTLIDRDPAVDEDNNNNPADELKQYFDAAQGRGMVFGVEAQQLALGEAMALFARKYEKNGRNQGGETDHKATDWNDEQHHDFAYVELQNMTPLPVPLNGGWSVVCEVVIASTPTPPTPRAVTLNDPASPIPPGKAFAVGTAGDAHNTGDPVRTAPSTPRVPWLAAVPTPSRPSHFAIDLDGSESADPPNFDEYQRIAPVTPTLDFDLMTRENDAAKRHTFRMTEVDPADLRRDQVAFGSIDDDEAPATAGTAPKAGGWLNLGIQTAKNDLDAGTVTVKFHLRRRLNLARTTPAEDKTNFPNVTYLEPPAAPTPARDAIELDNPWIVVDTMSVALDEFELNNATSLMAEADSIVSDHRVEPLTAAMLAAPDYAATLYGDYNNLGVQSAGGPMQLWQRHVDRPFASLADLLTVPLYGPGELTEAGTATGSAPVVRDPRQTAAANFLFPDANAALNPRPAGLSGTGVIPAALAPAYPAGNLWYRLFEFVEVPQKHGDNDSLPWFAHYGGPSQWLSDANQRQPWLRERLRLRDFGKLNLNTMRHPHALAGLLDDPKVMTFMNDRPGFGLPAGAGYLPSSAAAGGANLDMWLVPSPVPVPALLRDWWVSMVASRDGGFDPYTKANFPGQTAILPGVPSAKPFLDFGSGPLAATGIAGDFQRTLLRSLPKDANGAPPLEPDAIEDTAGRRALFELGDFGSGAGPILGSNAEFSTRYRLLGKVLNHGTTRSNTYVAFVQVDFFNATPAPGTTDGDHDGSDATPAVYQIGTKREDSPGYRGVFVIDRSLALELLKRRDLPPTDQGFQYPQNSKYRTFSFAREPGPDQRPQPAFKWRDLIQYRRIIAQ